MPVPRLVRGCGVWMNWMGDLLPAGMMPMYSTGCAPAGRFVQSLVQRSDQLPWTLNVPLRRSPPRLLFRIDAASSPAGCDAGRGVGFVLAGVLVGLAPGLGVEVGLTLTLTAGVGVAAVVVLPVEVAVARGCAAAVARAPAV